MYITHEIVKAGIDALVSTYGREAVQAAALDLLTCKCGKCGNTWTPRGMVTPKQCPRCKSIHWQAAGGAQ